MADLVQAVQLTAQMLRMRDAMLSVWGERYPVEVAKWQSFINEVADKKRVEPMQAAIQIAKEVADNGYAVIAVMASYVEMVSPRDVASPEGVAA